MAASYSDSDPDWLDQQYNPLLRVEDLPGMRARHDADSAAARERMMCRLDVRYGEGDNETLDVFPSPRRNSPVLVFIHGGYWRGSDKSPHSYIAESFVEEGFTVVMPNYPLCPAVKIEDIALCMTRALAWTYRHAAQHSGDPQRIVIVGHSAGGHLATMMASCDWKKVGSDLPADLASRVISISGLYDLEPFRHAPFLKDLVGLTPESVLALSPAGFPPPARGTLYAVVGGEEPAEFHRQNQLIQARWGSDRVPLCDEIEGHEHFSILEDLAAPNGRVHIMVLDMMGMGS